MAEVMLDEVDVFYVPHLRMKQLVKVCLEQIRKTDFTSNVALQALLRHLHDIFFEVKCHEDIEDNIILEKLQERMKSHCVDNTTVCDCHSNIHVGQMIALIDDGIAVTSRSSEDCMTFGIRLQEALNEFTSAFLPHMKQEEEVFQPLLLKHFEYSELQSIRQLVIVKHCLLTNNFIYETMLSSLSFEDELQTMRYQAEDDRRMVYEYVRNDLNSALHQNITRESMKSVISNGTYVAHGNPDENMEDRLASVNVTDKRVKQHTVMDLPDLAVTKIFSFLDPPDLGRCAQVCWAWNNLVYQPCLWRTVCPVQWALGYWKYEKDWNAEQHKITVLQGSRGNDYLFQGMGIQDYLEFQLAVIESMDVMFDLPCRYTNLLKRAISEYRVISG
ncbi:hypothetical protein B7P43_G09943 [Cryptotermes secundus]|nr:hypothetical protein B7P43_G09943 [Cryptotermes secundus]